MPSPSPSPICNLPTSSLAHRAPTSWGPWVRAHQPCVYALLYKHPSNGQATHGAGHRTQPEACPETWGGRQLDWYKQGQQEGARGTAAQRPYISLKRQQQPFPPGLGEDRGIGAYRIPGPRLVR